MCFKEDAINKINDTLGTDIEEGLHNRYSALNLAVAPMKVMQTSLQMEKGLSKTSMSMAQCVAWCKPWSKVLHIAVDYDNCNLQMVSCLRFVVLSIC